MNTLTVSPDQLEDIAFQTGATIDMGGDNPTLTHNGVTYVAGAL